MQLGPRRVTMAPVLRAPGMIRTLPDATATVRTTPRGISATWPDGMVLTLSLIRAGRGVAARTTIEGQGPDHISSLGIRLVDLDADRILVDGYHSWDWAGLRSLQSPGTGWWGAIAGNRGTTPLSIRLAEPPRKGALQLVWTGDGGLDVVTTGEPSQQAVRTGSATDLSAGSDAGDWVRIAPLAKGAVAGAGLPSLPRAARRPGRRHVGWMSWNCLGSAVTAADAIGATRYIPGGEFILLDDGWARRWGDWVAWADLGANLRDLAATLRNADRRLGLWIAPFLLDPESRVAAQHPDWLLADAAGTAPLIDNRPGAARYILDASRSDVRRHMHMLGAGFGKTGVAALKLDFLYAGASPGRRAGGPGWSGVRALREGVAALVEGFRATAPRGAPVWASGAPMPPLIGLADAGRGGGDAVINIPTAHTAPPPAPHFVHGATILNAQRRNLAARCWLWGATVPPDIDAVTLGRVGATPPVADAEASAWLQLAIDSGGPLLVSDNDVPASRIRALRRAQAAALDSPPRPRRTVDPLAGDPAPPEDDDFLSQPGALPDWR